MKQNPPTPLPETIKTTFIVLIALVILFLAIGFAVRLMQEELEEVDEMDEQDDVAIKIIDGDTFQLSSEEIIRLICVDTPETGEEGYEDAIAYLSNLILGKEIIIERAEEERVDKYNRTLAWVWVSSSDNMLVNKEIVDNGFGNLFEYNGSDCSRMI